MFKGNWIDDNISLMDLGYVLSYGIYLDLFHIGFSLNLLKVFSYNQWFFSLIPFKPIVVYFVISLRNHLVFVHILSHNYKLLIVLNLYVSMQFFFFF